MENKKLNNIFVTIVVIFIILLIIGLIYVIFASYNEKVTANSTSINNNSSTTTNFIFASSNCLNNSSVNYKLSQYNNSNVSVKLNSKRNVTLKYKGNSYTISNFTQDIEDIYVSGFGESYDNLTILYLMEDTTIQYTPIEDAINSDNLTSYGTVNGVKNIIKFHTADNDDGVAILAFKANGTYYDVSKILRTSENY